MSNARTVSLPDLEALLSQRIRSYIDAHQRSDVAEQDHHGRDLGPILARLLGRHLESRRDWNRYRWIDDLARTSISARTASSSEVRGLIIWGQRGLTKQWVEPFLASVSAPTSDTATLSYVLAFGSIADGLGRFPYGSHGTRFEPTDPEDWLFVFRKEAAKGAEEETRRPGS
jgi:hypothetical protein